MNGCVICEGKTAPYHPGAIYPVCHDHAGVRVIPKEDEIDTFALKKMTEKQLTCHHLHIAVEIEYGFPVECHDCKADSHQIIASYRLQLKIKKP